MASHCSLPGIFFAFLHAPALKPKLDSSIKEEYLFLTTDSCHLMFYFAVLPKGYSVFDALMTDGFEKN